MKTKIFEKQNSQLQRKMISTFGEDSLVDGILNLDKYNDSKPRVMWILNEPNWGDEYEDYNSDIKEISEDEISEIQNRFIEDKYYSDVTKYKNWKSTFKMISYVTYGILNQKFLDADIPAIDEEARINGEYMIDKIALVNVKKIPGDSNANPKEISKFYQSYKDELLYQINIINPDIIFNGSHAHELMHDLTDEIPSINYNKFYYKVDDNKIVINTYHPNKRSSMTDQQYIEDNLAIVKGNYDFEKFIAVAK